jgi:type IV fimbrial biogenesis protein FimT
MSRQRGFTLIELMVVVVLMAIIIAFATPGFEGAINSNRLTGAANEMMASLQAARSEAIRYNRRAVFCLSANANDANPACLAAANAGDASGWISFLDANRNGQYNAAGDTLLRAGTAHPTVDLRASAAVSDGVRVVFRSDGLARDDAGAIMTGTIDVCLPTRRPLENVRHVSIRAGTVVVTPFIANAACATPADNT